MSLLDPWTLCLLRSFVTSGLISVSFPAEDPTRGARLLHELSLAMLNDWTTFCTLTGPAQLDTPANKIDRLLDKLEWEKQQAVSEFVT